jgi:peptidoglycan hydrolase-like protein with peptidoglycan-binding domain
MRPPDRLAEPHRSRPLAARAHRHLSRSAAAAVAALVLVSGCSHGPEKPAAPAQPSASAASPSNPAAPARPADPEVRAAQDYLARLGYYSGPIDGINGPKTRTAVANYQTDSGLPPDGRVSRDLIARLAGAPSTRLQRDKVDRVAGPLYEPGDAYVYTDGQVETVLSMSENRVTWQDAEGQQWSANSDFTVPTRRSDPDADVASLRPFTWPLRVGDTASYTVKTAASDHVDHWQCIVESREQTAVVAGTFDSYKIVCRQGDDPPVTAASRTWYYAPAIGHYVRYVDNAANDGRSRDLIAVSPGELGWPPEARTGLEWAVSHALDAEPDGQAVPWQSSAVAARFVIEPGSDVDVGHSGECRRFKQTRIAADATKRVYPGVACRVQSRWRPFGSAAES